MFDPFFPLTLMLGPVALVLLLWIEAKRTTDSVWPLIASVALALPAAWGLFNLILVFAVALFGQGMNEAGFNRAVAISAIASVILIVASYSVVVYRRKH